MQNQVTSFYCIFVHKKRQKSKNKKCKNKKIKKEISNNNYRAVLYLPTGSIDVSRDRTDKKTLEKNYLSCTKVSSKTVYNNMDKYHLKALTIEQKKNTKKYKFIRSFIN